jgi:hypothetical protein
VAEHLKAPLYSISAAELGNTVSDAAETLEMILELSAEWNAVVLLPSIDEIIQQLSGTEESKIQFSLGKSPSRT